MKKKFYILLITYHKDGTQTRQIVGPPAKNKREAIQICRSNNTKNDNDCLYLVETIVEVK